MVGIGNPPTAFPEAILRESIQNAGARFKFTIIRQEPCELRCNYLSGALTSGRALQTVWSVTADIGNIPRSELRAELKRLVVKCLINCYRV
jgi:hypothetical protein